MTEPAGSPAPEAPAAGRRALRWILALLTLALLAHLATRVTWREVWATAAAASPAWLIAATVVNLATPAVRGARWWLFLRPAGSSSLTLALRATYVGSGLNNLVPASGGDAARALLVARRSMMHAATALATLAVDRLVESATYLTLALLAPAVVPVPAIVRRGAVTAALILAAVLVVSVTGARVARMRAGSTRIPSSRRGRLRVQVGRFFTGVEELATARRVTAAVVLSLIAWTLQAITYHLTALATGLPVSFAASALAMLAVNLAFMLPLTPGNLGVFQAVYALVMVAFGSSGSAATATALLLQGLQILPMTALALVLGPDLLLRRRYAPGA